MCKKFTPDELNKMDHKTKDGVIYQMQDRLDQLERNYENLMEQVRLANQQRFGRHTEKLEDISGQLFFFNEAEANCNYNFLCTQKKDNCNSGDSCLYVDSIPWNCIWFYDFYQDKHNSAI